jgi:hypothetical protein
MPGKEKKNAGVWQPVPPDRPAAAIKKMAMGAVLPTLGKTFRLDQWENTVVKKTTGPLLTFFKAIGLKKKNYLLL